MAKNKQQQDELPVVSRKTNEEVDTDDQGNLILHGDAVEEQNAETNPKKSSTLDTQQHAED